MQKNIQKGTKGITLIALVITIIVLLILAGVTISQLTGSDSAPAKANEAAQKNAIGEAKDDVQLTAINAQTEAYERVYVEGKQATSDEDVTVGNASNNVGIYVRAKVYEEYKASKAKKVGVASIVATEDGQITISTTDFKEIGLIDLSGGVLSWITPVPITSIGAITASNTEVKETKTITLTAPINNNATESLTWTCSDNTVATVTSTGKNTAEVKGLTGQAGNSVTITASYENLTPVTIEISVIENVVESYVGKYADLDNDNEPDGIIFADLLAHKPTEDYWHDQNGRYTLPTISNVDNVKEYEISGNTTDSRFEKSDADSTSYTSRDVVKLSNTSTGTEKRFYVMGLTNYNNGATYNWTTAKDLTDTTTDGTLTYSWLCPTKEQWSMFGKAFEITSSTYLNYGLSEEIWASTEYDSAYGWYAYFSCGRMGFNYKRDRRYVRLCTTF